MGKDRLGINVNLEYMKKFEGKNFVTRETETRKLGYAQEFKDWIKQNPGVIKRFLEALNSGEIDRTLSTNKPFRIGDATITCRMSLVEAVALEWFEKIPYFFCFCFGHITVRLASFDKDFVLPRHFRRNFFPHSFSKFVYRFPVISGKLYRGK